MSSGCIIVALKNPNVEEIIKHAQNGFLVDDKELSFVEAIKDISKYTSSDFKIFYFLSNFRQLIF